MNFQKNAVFKPKFIIKNLLSERKFNFYFYGLFNANILKNGFNLCEVKSGDRFILLQYALCNYDFGYIRDSIFYRGIHNITNIQRYPNDILEQKLENQKWLLDFYATILLTNKIFKLQKIKKLSLFKRLSTLHKVFIFLVKRQIILIARYIKHEIILTSK